MLGAISPRCWFHIWPTSSGVALASMLFCSTAAQSSRRSCAKGFASRSQRARTASRRSLWRTTSRPWLWPAEPRDSGPAPPQKRAHRSGDCPRGRAPPFNVGLHRNSERAAACRCLKLDRKGFQTRTGSAIPRTAPWWWWKAATLAIFVTGTITSALHLPGGAGPIPRADHAGSQRRGTDVSRGTCCEGNLNAGILARVLNTRQW